MAWGPRTWGCGILVALFLGSVAGRSAREIHAAEIHVPEDFPTIQAALDAAADGDTVLAAPGEHVIREPLDFNRLHDPRLRSSPPLKNVTLRATVDAAADPKGRGAVIKMVFQPKDPLRASAVIFEKGEGPASVLEGFTITGGSGTEFIAGAGAVGGGGIFIRNGSRPTIIRCRIDGNRADGASSAGGGVFCHGSAPRFEDCVISNNTAGRGGGIFCFNEGASPVFRECTVVDNRAAGNGGGVLAEGMAAPALEGCTVFRNAAGFLGGGIVVAGGSMVLTSTAIEDNRAAEGGGISAAGSVSLEGCRIASNHGGGLVCQPAARVAIEECVIAENFGGGVFCYFGSVTSFERTAISGNRGLIGAGISILTPHATLTGCRITDNIASYRGGGALFGASSPRLVDCEIRRNFAEVSGGGAVFEFGSSAELIGCRFVENAAGEFAGGLLVTAAAPRLADCEISSNVAGHSGGGAVFELGSGGVLERCAIAGNGVQQTGGLGDQRSWGGGGILCDTGSTPLLDRCTLAGNRSHIGGALTASEAAAPRLLNCVIAGNLAGLWGGGVLAFAASPQLIHCTVSGNRAERGGGIHCSFAVPVLESSIVWGNEPAGACGRIDRTLSGSDPRFARPGKFDFGRFRYLEIAGRRFIAPDFILDPGDYRLQPGSPAIDAGAAEHAPESDHSGRPRSCDAAPDLGAHERCGDVEWRFRRGDSDGDGRVEMADAVDILERLFSGAGLPACAESADADDSGAIDLTDPVYLLSYLFLGGPEPPEPFAACGSDPTADGLRCLYHPKCD